ncbi:hypothetical protein CQW23_08905 [Capsicum baccatum]|uniref:THO complex subunit 4D n=1 Tax=Capsicum baccatum TaxID=33114 RepID=A0A2G2XAD7_CAPBA|nr:hypothetical protein CQW23_08905 [Capsicum baccatum]
MNPLRNICERFDSFSCWFIVLNTSMASLDMTLEDMIKSRRNSEKGGRGQGRARRGRGQGGSFRGGRTTGAPRRGALGVNARPSANRIAKASSKLSKSFAFPRQFDML